MIRFLFLFSLLSIAFSSCRTVEIAQGFETILPIDSLVVPPSVETGHRIAPNDKLTISIWDHDDMSVGSTFGIYNSNEVYGKWLLVNDLGVVTLPELGKVNLGGLTMTEASDYLTVLYGEILTNPVIVVKVLNKEVTILGEVKNAGLYVLDKERTHLMELIGRAGGMLMYADHNHVQLLRKIDQQIYEYEIDLEALNEQEYERLYLIPGDVVQIPARQSLVFDKRAGSALAIASVISTIALLFAL